MIFRKDIFLNMEFIDVDEFFGTETHAVLLAFME